MIFKPEDFREYCIKNPGAPHDECIAEIANKILNEWLKNAPTMLCDKRRYMAQDGEYFIASSNNEIVNFYPTHKAKLVLIKEIEP